MKRKLLRYGKELAVTIPAEVVKAFHLGKGSTVDLRVDSRTGTITIDPGILYFDGGKVTARFRKLTEEIAVRWDAVFRKLAE